MCMENIYKFFFSFYNTVFSIFIECGATVMQKTDGKVVIKYLHVPLTADVTLIKKDLFHQI